MSQLALEVEPPLRWIVHCPVCREVIDVIEEGELTSPPGKHWQEATQWATIARVQHDLVCEGAPPVTSRHRGASATSSSSRLGGDARGR